jgi:hypothetical protein
MTPVVALDEYFDAARSWDTDRSEQYRRSAAVAWWVAAAGWISAVASAAALLTAMPLKRVEPFVVRVDNTTGIVDVVPVYTGGASQDEVVTRYFLTHYLTVCERFNLRRLPFRAAKSDLVRPMDGHESGLAAQRLQGRHVGAGPGEVGELLHPGQRPRRSGAGTVPEGRASGRRRGR